MENHQRRISPTFWKIIRVLRITYAQANTIKSAINERHPGLHHPSKSRLEKSRRRRISGLTLSASRKSAPIYSSAISGRTERPSDSRTAPSDPQFKTLSNGRSHGARVLASRSENAIRRAKSSFSKRRHAQTAPLGAKRTTDSDSTSQGLSSHVASNSAGARRRFLQQHFESFGPATPPSLRLPAKEGTLQRHQVPRDRVRHLVQSILILE